MKKLECIWLSRDSGDPGRYYAQAWSEKPSKEIDGLRHCEDADGHLFNTEYYLMRRIFGITLRPGQCKRVKVEVTEQ